VPAVLFLTLYRFQITWTGPRPSSLVCSRAGLNGEIHQAATAPIRAL